MTRPCLLAAAILGPTAPLSAQTYFMVGARIDLRANHPGSLHGDDIVRSHLNLSAAGKPLNRFDVGDNATHMIHGFVYPNMSGSNVRGIRLRVDNPDRHRFDPAQCGGGGIFNFVEVRDEGKEVVFGGGFIPAGETYQTAITYINIQKYKDSAGRVVWYRGEALTADPGPDAEGGGFDRLWADMEAACPSNFRRPDAYAVDDGMGHLCMFGEGTCHVYDAKAGRLSQVLPEARFGGLRVNRITFDKAADRSGAFVLWHNQRRLGVVKLDSLDVYRTFEKGK